jgi:ubiquinol-cytochrome c reductase iron-sulfur subunit
MSDSSKVDPSRRRFLTNLTTGIGAVGAVFVATPFVLSMNPSARAKAAGAPVEVDFSKLEPGQMMTIEWRGKPVWIVNRTPEMLAKLAAETRHLSDPGSDVLQQPEYAKNDTRSIKPGILVLVGICTHLGCAPKEKFEIGVEPDVLGNDWPGGFFCPCHGSKFDLAGRVYKGVPAPTNLEVPPHQFLTDTRILIGADEKGEA